jgi:hypothetical protein
VRIGATDPVAGEQAALGRLDVADHDAAAAADPAEGQGGIGAPHTVERIEVDIRD